MTIGSPNSSHARTRTWTGRSTSTSTCGRLRQPSSEISSSLPAPLDLRIDERRDRRLLLDPVDEHPVEDPDLRGGEADPDRVVHQQTHAPDLLAQRIVEALHGARLGAQDQIAEFAHVGQRRVTPCRGLGIEMELVFGRPDLFERLVELVCLIGGLGHAVLSLRRPRGDRTRAARGAYWDRRRR